MKNVQLTQQQINFIYGLLNLFVNDTDLYLILVRRCYEFFNSEIEFRVIVSELNALKNEFSLLAD
jgi:hypothetical protein